MSHKEYLRYGTRAQQLTEECAELILAISKANRFGLFAKDPLTNQEHDNYMDIFKEMSDVREAIERYEQELRQLKGQGLFMYPMPVRI